MSYEILEDEVKLIWGDSNLFISNEKLIPALSKGLAKDNNIPVTLIFRQQVEVD